MYTPAWQPNYVTLHRRMAFHPNYIALQNVRAGGVQIT